MRLNRNTEIIAEHVSEPVKKAIQNLRRDLNKSCLFSEEKGDMICLAEGKEKPECFRLICRENKLLLFAAEELGFIYGIYEISRRILGIENFWFWNDQKIQPRESYTIPEGFELRKESAAVRFRGWFVNDEVLLHTWSVNRRREEPWEMVFEALLRCGGNLVIPGTDHNAAKYRALAASMGLYITHHHAEPLGAEMFSRAYPQLNPSYEEYPEKFQQLWREAIEAQKKDKIVWNIGFRGQGDCPFWVNDPRYQTQKDRGALMSRLIRLQYDMVKEQCPQAVCCTNLYGETMELYEEGYLDLPEDVILIWADNGYGKMVTRRQENHNPRVPALPKEVGYGHHGIYYHVSFYDLQAANHMTMLPNAPEFVKQELEQVIDKKMTDYWIINCSNVKPHVYYLDLLSKVWQQGTVDLERHRKEYVLQYYGEESSEQVAECLKEYFQAAVSYGEHEDEKAGEQFTNHVPRMLVTQFMTDREKPAENLRWMRKGKNLQEQIMHYRERCLEGAESYRKLCHRYECTAVNLPAGSRTLFEDSLGLQANLHFRCFRGALLVCESLREAYKEDYQKAFYLAGKAREEYQRADRAMRGREHGKWKDFYANECLTDMKQTAWVLKALMGYLRNLGDGPHYYQWQREYLYSEEDRRVMLIMNMENHLEDEDLFALMKAKIEEQQSKQ